ncbi:MAG: glycosyltransferase [Muribaculaceae bacterium]|nr:glycosyltransferase [Roseburia sp.]MCM1431359.1 glycosyltransferase [Muribaculaceae bacterium]MCM1491801.1 glycosyltransferase [Muribaculaceae bacterium]
MEALVSVIVPVYNVEQYLPRCIDSILGQTYKELEIYLVDDGSTDRGGEICDEYQKRDSRIRVIHKENAGLSEARNAALDVISGQYVTFVDSDDFISGFYVENLYRALKTTDADMAVSRFVNYYAGDRLPVFAGIDDAEIEVLSSIQCMERLFYQENMDTSAWGKLYRAQDFKNIRYPRGKWYEDILVTYRMIKACGKVAFVSSVDYLYVQRADSIQNVSFQPKKLDAVEQMHDLQYEVKNTFPELAGAVDCRCFSAVCNILFQIPRGEYPEYREMLWSELKHLRKCVLSNSRARKKARYAAMLSYLGYGAVYRIYHMLDARGRGVHKKKYE